MAKRNVRPEVDSLSLEPFKVVGTALVFNTLKELAKKREPIFAFLAGSDSVFAIGSVVRISRDSIEIEFKSDQALCIESVDQADLQFVSEVAGVKTQFKAKVIHAQMLEQSSLVQCALPRVAYRIQRRGAFRVRPAPGSQPEIVVRTAPGHELGYEILDLSATGVSFVLRDEQLELQPGDVFEHTRLELGPRVPIPCTVVVRTVREALHPESKERINRVGAEFLNLPNDVARMIQISVQDAERAFLRVSR